MYCYFNGELMPVEQAAFKTNDLSVLRGYGMFDYFRTYNGVPFQWDWYWQRFKNSAATLRLPLPLTQTQTADILAELYKLAQTPEVSYRFVLTGGYSPDSVNMVQPNLLILTENLPKDNPEGRIKGIKLLPYEFVRDMPEVKTTNYLHMVRLAQEMKSQNAADLLYHKDGEISELTRSNFFIFKGDTLITPDRNILHGITRRYVMELAAPLFKIEVRPLRMEELLEADEAFTTSSTKWVMPIVQIGRQIIGNGLPGQRTLKLWQLFEESVKNYGLATLETAR
ncbi:MAG: aminotransferase IV [Runella slithyformis]|nr:MAG: aminotransferase IV [Runella slithyformis]TAE96925.1 MAG: aminotransferase IV [Runella slithyformis]TAF28430.1 MAG: aminotransferase IV [Runella slithyformis]TAF47069.1 MAG: aminotransferase IV [Runella slithyformis]TAF81998.1 MAG: aminotransferase IV [Runella slithyformis]